MARVVVMEVRRLVDDRQHTLLQVDGKDEWLMKTRWPNDERKPLYKGTKDRATAAIWQRCLLWALSNDKAELVAQEAGLVNELRNA